MSWFLKETWLVQEKEQFEFCEFKEGKNPTYQLKAPEQGIL